VLSADTFSGSAWKDYRATGKICGIALPPACANPTACPNPSSRPPQSGRGHDENIPFEQATALIGKKLAEKVCAVSLEIYRRAAAYAERAASSCRHQVRIWPAQ